MSETKHLWCGSYVQHSSHEWESPNTPGLMYDCGGRATGFKASAIEARPVAPTVGEIEAAITMLGRKCKRNGRFWREYLSSHEEINHLLDDRDRQIEFNRQAVDRARRDR